MIEDIIDILNSEPVEEQAFKLTGIRGTGKTVTLTAIERELKEDDKWIIVDLNDNIFYYIKEYDKTWRLYK